jgi:hypothetical protein
MELVHVPRSGNVRSVPRTREQSLPRSVKIFLGTVPCPVPRSHRSGNLITKVLPLFSTKIKCSRLRAIVDCAMHPLIAAVCNLCTGISWSDAFPSSKSPTVPAPGYYSSLFLPLPPSLDLKLLDGYACAFMEISNVCGSPIFMSGSVLSSFANVNYCLSCT